MQTKQVAGDKPAWDGMLYEAIPIFAASLADVETQWDAEKLNKKLREYFNKAAKNMTFRGRMAPLVNEYIDNALGTVFNALGDRDWVTQVDMLMLLDAGIKDNFPSFMFKGMSQHQFETMVMQSYERSYEEQKFHPILSEAMNDVPAGKTKKKLWNAVEGCRKNALKQPHVTAEEFVYAWIATAVAQLAQGARRGPEWVFSSADLTGLLTTVIAAGSVPMKLQQEGQDPPVSIIEEAVTAAYAEHHVPEPEGGWDAYEGSWGEKEAEAGEGAEQQDADPDAAPPPAKKAKGVFGVFGK